MNYCSAPRSQAAEELHQGEREAKARENQQRYRRTNDQHKPLCRHDARRELGDQIRRRYSQSPCLHKVLQRQQGILRLLSGSLSHPGALRELDCATMGQKGRSRGRDGPLRTDIPRRFHPWHGELQRDEARLQVEQVSSSTFSLSSVVCSLTNNDKQLFSQLQALD